MIVCDILCLSDTAELDVPNGAVVHTTIDKLFSPTLLC